MSINPVQWLLPWEPSITAIVVTAATVWFYYRGCRKNRPSLARQISFWLGLASIYAVLQTQFDYYSEHEFFMHRIQHSVLHHIGPFLIALARPGSALAAGFKAVIPAKKAGIHASTHQYADRWISVFAGTTKILNNSVIAVLLFCGLILFWLIPSIHFIAMLDWRLYRVMNWGMVINGLMFWNLALNNDCLRPTRLSPASRMIMMLAIIPPQIIIGMLIFTAKHDLYPIYSICGRAFTLSPLADQQVGGLILWISAAMMSVVGILMVLQREWLHKAFPRV